MGMDLILTHLVFIVVMSTVSYLWGEYAGKELGRKEMVFDMLDRKLVTPEQLNKEYMQ
tara:strand:+ start:326 stop:499 length:174 start_codon:yes stop_codon:yes gene_type:complete